MLDKEIDLFSVFWNPTFIDIILTYKEVFFKNTDVIEVGVPNHHSSTVTALKSILLKGNAKTKLYQHYSFI